MIRRLAVLVALLVLVGAALALLLIATEAKPLDTIALVELVTAMSGVQIFWQVSNAQDARRDVQVSRGFPRFGLRRIDFRWYTHLLRLLIAVGYLIVGLLGIIAPVVPVPPHFPFLDSADDWALGCTVILGEFGFTVLSGWDFYHREQEERPPRLTIEPPG